MQAAGVEHVYQLDGGVLNAVAMIVSQLSALTVLPALLFLRERRRARRASGPTS